MNVCGTSRTASRGTQLFLLLVATLCLNAAALAQAQETAQPKPQPIAVSDDILARLPPDYREEAKQVVRMTSEQQAQMAKLSDEELATDIVYYIGDAPTGSDFLVARLEKEPAPKLRSTIIEATSSYWAAHPEAQKLLVQHAESDPDADVALASLDQLRQVRMQELGKLLEARLAVAKSAGDTAGAAKLDAEQERRYQWYGEIAPPAFMRVPPPVFSVAPADKAIRVLSFGDFGTGSPAQINLAKAMVEYHKRHPFSFGLTLGDNFYPRGMVSPSDPRWQSQWEQLYGPLGIKFYPTFGNHDYGLPDSPAAEIMYSAKSPDWRFPAPYYTFRAGPVQFFAIDNISLSDAELLWLDQELAKSRSPWKLVYGHYHIYSATRGDNKELIEKLLPILKKHHVDVYMNGHDHNLQEVKPDGSVHFFVSGGGGAMMYDVEPYDKATFKRKVNGFTVIEADANRLKVSFVGMDGKELHADSLKK